MKIYRLPQLVDSAPGGRYRLGPESLDTDAVFLEYLRLGPGTEPVRLPADTGYDCVIYVQNGQAAIESGKKTFSVGAGEAFRAPGEVEIRGASADETVCLIAGGRSAARPASGRAGGAGAEDALKERPPAAGTRGAEPSGGPARGAGHGEEPEDEGDADDFLITEEGPDEEPEPF